MLTQKSDLYKKLHSSSFKDVCEEVCTVVRKGEWFVLASDGQKHFSSWLDTFEFS